MKNTWETQRKIILETYLKEKCLGNLSQRKNVLETYLKEFFLEIYLEEKYFGNLSQRIFLETYLKEKIFWELISKKPVFCLLDCNFLVQAFSSSSPAWTTSEWSI